MQQTQQFAHKMSTTSDFNYKLQYNHCKRGRFGQVSETQLANVPASRHTQLAIYRSCQSLERGQNPPVRLARTVTEPS